MKKKKVASLFAFLKVWWWVEKVQANLSIWLTDLWYEFYHILSEDIWPKNDYKWEIITLNNPFVLWFWIKKIWSLFTNAFKVSRICKKEKIDVLIWQWDYFFMISGLVKLLWFKWKSIAVVHTTIWIWPKYLNLLLRFFLNLNDKIVLISNEEFNTFINKYWFKKEKLEFIYNSIDLEENSQKIQENLPIEYKNIFKNWKFTFINIWRLTPQKNQRLLLDAFEVFHKKYNKSQLIILWDWELREDLNNFRSNLSSKDDIYFLWKQENVFSFLKHSDCFVLSSLFEGFWLVLIEAMVAWLPIISTKCPSWPIEILSWKNTDGFEVTNNAILITNWDIDEMCKAMENMYLNTKIREKISKNNLIKVKEFDKSIIISKWENFIDSL